MGGKVTLQFTVAMVSSPWWQILSFGHFEEMVVGKAALLETWCVWKRNGEESKVGCGRRGKWPLP